MTNPELPTVTVLLLTYEDGERHTAARTLGALMDNMRYDGPLNLHVADDGSIPGHVDELLEIASSIPYFDQITSTNAERGGYGRSYNLATQVIHDTGADIVLPLEDDWELSRALDLGPLVESLDGQYRGGGVLLECIRLGYLGFTNPLYANLFHSPAGPMAMLDQHSIETHVFAGHPRLETVRFEKNVGPWPEGMRAGETEVEVAHRSQARIGIAWPFDLGPASMRGDSLFAHIGDHGLGGVTPEQQEAE